MMDPPPTHWHIRLLSLPPTAHPSLPTQPIPLATASPWRRRRSPGSAPLAHFSFIPSPPHPSLLLPQGYCQSVVAPKVSKIRAKFFKLLSAL